LRQIEPYTHGSHKNHKKRSKTWAQPPQREFFRRDHQAISLLGCLTKNRVFWPLLSVPRNSKNLLRDLAGRWLLFECLVSDPGLKYFYRIQKYNLNHHISYRRHRANYRRRYWVEVRPSISQIPDSLKNG